MMVALLVVLGVLVWVGAGLFFAPRAAALAYNHNFYASCYPDSTESYILEGRKEAATNGFYLGLLVPFPTMIYWFCNQYIYHAIKNMAEGQGAMSIEKALVKHVPVYRDNYLNDLERKNAALESENMRLTEQVLGTRTKG